MCHVLKITYTFLFNTRMATEIDSESQTGQEVWTLLLLSLLKEVIEKASNQRENIPVMTKK